MAEVKLILFERVAKLLCLTTLVVPHDSLSGQLGAWLRDSRCLRVRLRGLGFGVGGQRLRTRLICCARFLAALVVGPKRTDDCRKDASDTDQDQGNYQGVSKEVFY